MTTFNQNPALMNWMQQPRAPRQNPMAAFPGLSGGGMPGHAPMQQFPAMPMQPQNIGHGTGAGIPQMPPQAPAAGFAAQPMQPQRDPGVGMDPRRAALAAALRGGA